MLKKVFELGIEDYGEEKWERNSYEEGKIEKWGKDGRGGSEEE